MEVSVARVALFANRYDRKERLGKGHLSTVWRAFDQNLGIDVALKVFRTGTDISMATDEAQRLMAMKGRHVLPVLNADHYQDVPFIVTYIAEAGTADDRAKGRGVSPSRAISWVRDALVGLSVCHDYGFLHRDVKGSNIFLKSDDEAELGDFGLVAKMDAGGTAPPHGLWTVRAPELFAGQPATIRSDVYSTGLALYQLLAGFDPFWRSTEAESIAAVKARDFTRIRDVCPHVPRVLAMRIEMAMADDPTQRYGSAMALHSALGEIRHLPITWARSEPHRAMNGAGTECTKVAAKT
jgi:serine/threonine-protein kinase